MDERKDTINRDSISIVNSLEIEKEQNPFEEIGKEILKLQKEKNKLTAQLNKLKDNKQSDEYKKTKAKLDALKKECKDKKSELKQQILKMIKSIGDDKIKKQLSDAGLLDLDIKIGKQTVKEFLEGLKTKELKTEDLIQSEDKIISDEKTEESTKESVVEESPVKELVEEVKEVSSTEESSQPEDEIISDEKITMEDYNKVLDLALNLPEDTTGKIQAKIEAYEKLIEKYKNVQNVTVRKKEAEIFKITNGIKRLEGELKKLGKKEVGDQFEVVLEENPEKKNSKFIVKSYDGKWILINGEGGEVGDEVDIKITEADSLKKYYVAEIVLKEENGNNRTGELPDANNELIKEIQIKATEEEILPLTLSDEARDLLDKIDKGQSMLDFISKNLQKIAKENGIEVTDDTTPDEIIKKLRDIRKRIEEKKKEDEMKVIDELPEGTIEQINKKIEEYKKFFKEFLNREGGKSGVCIMINLIDNKIKELEFLRLQIRKREFGL